MALSRRRGTSPGAATTLSPRGAAEATRRSVLAALGIILGATRPVQASPLAPTGILRIGVVAAPTAGLFFVSVDPAGQPHGVTADLGRAMARALGVPAAFSTFPNSGECTDAVASGAVDVAFMPVDPARSARVLFGSAYYVLESTYLVSAASGIATLADVDRPGIRVVGIANTTTIRASARTLAHTQPVPIRGVEDAIAALQGGQADALALSRDSLVQIAATIPGSRLLAGGFQQTTVSVAVPPGQGAAMAQASALIDGFKRDGTIKRAFAGVGLADEAVAG